MPNLICLAPDSPLFPQVPGEFSPANFPVLFEQAANVTIGGHLPHMSRLSRSTVSIARMQQRQIRRVSRRRTDAASSDRPDITPETRPPAGMQYGIQPPPGAQWQQQPIQQPPPQAQGGLGYK